MLSHAIQNPFETTMFGGRLIINYQLHQGFSKPILIVSIPNIYERTFAPLFSQCGFYKHQTLLERNKYNYTWLRTIPPYIWVKSFKLIGHRATEEALKVLISQAPLMCFNEVYPMVTYSMNGQPIFTPLRLPTFDYLDTSSILSTLRENTLQKIREKNIAKQKDMPVMAIKNFDKMPIIKEEAIKKGVSKIVVKGVNNQLITYFKKDSNGPYHAIEAFTNELLLTLLGDDYGSRMYLLFDSAGSRVGMMSTEIPGFETLSSIYEKQGIQISMSFIEALSDRLIQAGIGKIEAFNYLFAEADFNTKNVGFGQNGHLYKIDCGRALWAIACAGVDLAEDEEYKPFTWVDASCPKDAFPIHEEDILTLPFLKHAKPHNALYLFYKLNNAVHLIQQMAQNSKFLDDKWYIFFKYLLLDESIYKARLDGYFSSVNWKNTILDYLLKRKELVQEKLLHLPQFALYMQDAGERAFSQAVQDFENSNNNYASSSTTNRYASFKVDINNIRKTGESLLQQFKPKEVQTCHPVVFTSPSTPSKIITAPPPPVALLKETESPTKREASYLKKARERNSYRHYLKNEKREDHEPIFVDMVLNYVRAYELCSNEEIAEELKQILNHGQEDNESETECYTMMSKMDIDICFHLCRMDWSFYRFFDAKLAEKIFQLIKHRFPDSEEDYKKFSAGLKAECSNNFYEAICLYATCAAGYEKISYARLLHIVRNQSIEHRSVLDADLNKVDERRLFSLIKRIIPVDNKIQLLLYCLDRDTALGKRFASKGFFSWSEPSSNEGILKDILDYLIEMDVGHKKILGNEKLIKELSVSDIVGLSNTLNEENIYYFIRCFDPDTALGKKMGARPNQDLDALNAELKIIYRNIVKLDERYKLSIAQFVGDIKGDISSPYRANAIFKKKEIVVNDGSMNTQRLFLKDHHYKK